MSDTPRTDAAHELLGMQGKVSVYRMETLEREFAAMTVAKELAERQVMALLPFVLDGCPPGRHVGQEAVCMKSISCNQCWIGWSRAEAAKELAALTANAESEALT